MASLKAQQRYVTQLTTKVLPDGRTVYNSARPADVITTINDATIVADEQTRLDVIAKNVYGTPLDWYKIVAANQVNQGSLHVPPGTILTIPRK